MCCEAKGIICHLRSPAEGSPHFVFVYNLPSSIPHRWRRLFMKSRRSISSCVWMKTCTTETSHMAAYLRRAWSGNLSQASVLHVTVMTMQQISYHGCHRALCQHVFTLCQKIRLPPRRFRNVNAEKTSKMKCLICSQP